MTRKISLSRLMLCIFISSCVESIALKRCFRSSMKLHSVNTQNDHLPLLITIGPQCAGKTTALLALNKKLSAFERNIEDVAIDDHPFVYHKLNTLEFLNDTYLSSSQILHGKKLQDRMEDYVVAGQIAVAKRLEKLITANDFAAQWMRITKRYPFPDKSVDDTWLLAVEEAVNQNIKIQSATVDLFIPDGHYPNGVRDSNRRLRQVCTSHPGPVAWGNTNAKSKDYIDALKCAEDTNRPVHFLRWGYELPEVPLSELFARNIRRFSTIGRYIPPQAIALTLRRVQHLYSRTEGGTPKLLAAAAGFNYGSNKRIEAFQRGPGAALLVKNTPPKRITREPLRAREDAGSTSQFKFSTAPQFLHKPQRNGMASVGVLALPIPLNEGLWSPVLVFLTYISSQVWEELFSGRRPVYSLNNILGPCFGSITGVCKEVKEIFSRPMMSKEWDKYRTWRHTQWTKEDIKPTWPVYRESVVNGTENSLKKTGDNYAELDTIDLVRVINGDKNSKYKF